jgi:hypothetical protein
VRGNVEFDSDQESGFKIASRNPARSKKCHFLRQIPARADPRLIVKIWFAQVPSWTESAEALLELDMAAVTRRSAEAQ